MVSKEIAAERALKIKCDREWAAVYSKSCAESVAQRLSGSLGSDESLLCKHLAVWISTLNPLYHPQPDHKEASGRKGAGFMIADHFGGFKRKDAFLNALKDLRISYLSELHHFRLKRCLETEFVQLAWPTPPPPPPVKKIQKITVGAYGAGAVATASTLNVEMSKETDSKSVPAVFNVEISQDGAHDPNISDLQRDAAAAGIQLDIKAKGAGAVYQKVTVTVKLPSCASPPS
jgi:hypothetical protein